jgi:hypothetical protein
MDEGRDVDKSCVFCSLQNCILKLTASNKIFYFSKDVLGLFCQNTLVNSAYVIKPQLN